MTQPPPAPRPDGHDVVDGQLDGVPAWATSDTRPGWGPGPTLDHPGPWGPAPGVPSGQPSPASTFPPQAWQTPIEGHVVAGHQGAGQLVGWGQPAVQPVDPHYPVAPQEYHHVWRAPAYRWWKGLLALGLVGVLTVVVQVLAGLPILLESMAPDGSFDTPTLTPMAFLLNNLGIAAWIPITLLAAWVCTRQRPGWLSSVTGRLRWGWMWRAGAIIAVVWILQSAAVYGLAFAAGVNPFADWRVTDQTLPLVAIILGTTVFQCAGEEYLCRGLVNRTVASWVPSRVAGLVVGWLVNAVVFMSLHLAGDIYLNLMYFSFATAATWLTWRTGGLEAAIALHCVNNLLAEAALPFVDISGLFDRGAGTANASVLLVVPFMVLVCWLVGRAARRRGLQRLTAPVPDGGPAELAPVPPSPAQPSVPLGFGGPSV